jgi:hypothetical protein
MAEAYPACRPGPHIAWAKRRTCIGEHFPPECPGGGDIRAQRGGDPVLRII